MEIGDRDATCPVNIHIHTNIFGERKKNAGEKEKKKKKIFRSNWAPRIKFNGL